MSYAERVSELKRNQAEAARLSAVVAEGVSELESVLKALVAKRWKEAFPTVDLKHIEGYMVMMHGGSAVSGWDPSILIRKVGKAFYTSSGKWAEVIEHHMTYYAHSVDFVESPVPMQDLDIFMTLLSKETGLPVKLDVVTIETEAKDVESLNDLKAIHGKDIKEIESGATWYVGWDISDKYCIFSEPSGKIHVYYGENAHGGGMTVHVEPGNKEALDAFFRHAESGDGSALRGRYEKQIQDSWK